MQGLRVLAFESRRANEMAQLLRKQGAEPVIAPAVREVPIEANEEAFRFAERLFAGEFDMVILLTGVGTRYLAKILVTRYPEERFVEALRGLTVIVRGPKPAAVLREWNVPFAAMAPEPNTWREVLQVVEGRSEKRIAIQEYGRTNEELVAALQARGASVSSVPVYQWELPEDVGPLQQAVRELADGKIDVVMFTTRVQAEHLMQVAAGMGLEDQVRSGLKRAKVASIGPTTTEGLAELGITPNFEPSHPKMGILVQEALRENR